MLPGLVLAAALTGASPAFADCGPLRTAVDEAQRAKDTDRLRDLFEDVVVETSCDDALRAHLGTVIARLIERQVFDGVNSGKSLAGFEKDLKASLGYRRLWRTEAWLGDISLERGNHAEASRHYQAALAEIQDERATPKAPPPEVIETIFKRAQESRLLADTYVGVPTTRSGEPTGLGAVELRGFKPNRVAVPIEFEYDSDTFTPKGQAAVADLLAMLEAQSMPPVVLVGHTDPKGDEDYNLKLSQRRAEAVRRFMAGSGYTGEIRTEGRGEAEPLELDDPGRYTVEQVHQMYRRVELRR